MNLPWLKKIHGTPVRLTVLIFLLMVVKQSSFAATVVYISKSSELTNTYEQIKAVSQFYGLEVNAVDFTSGDAKSVLKAIRDPNAAAIVIDANALPYFDRQQFFKQKDHKVSLLIAGINETTNRNLLREWSSGNIVACQKFDSEPKEKLYVTKNLEKVTRQLSGIQLPFPQKELRYLVVDSTHAEISLIDAAHGNTTSPVFVRTISGGQDIFFTTESDPIDLPVTADPYRQQAEFGALASALIFLHFAAGEKAWHSPGDYANLTIDDIWLKEPYGHVDYKGLLKEAQLHNFHVTAAFIPWNFDRSQPELVSLFRTNPDRLSISVHGNNHIHQEFGPLESHPLSKQVADIKQGLARMEKFSQLTHIPYDAVMVFPHSISPEATLAELKRYNFLATANSLNVPSDAVAPAGAEFILRTATLQFADFPSLRRYSAETDIPEPQLAIDAFLGNPMLFYVHESFFSSGIGAFNPMANTVNRLQPDTQWKNLGYIAKHLYLEKLRDDRNYDVQAYSANIELQNTEDRDVVYFVKKDENFAVPLKVRVDGKPYPFKQNGKQLLLELLLHKGQSSEVTIQYGNDLNLASVGIAKDSFRTNTIRRLSDFRDDVVSKTFLGRTFIHSYAENSNVWNRAIVIVVSFILVLLVLRRIKKGRKGVISLHGPSIAK